MNIFLILFFVLLFFSFTFVILFLHIYLYWTYAAMLHLKFLLHPQSSSSVLGKTRGYLSSKGPCSAHKDEDGCEDLVSEPDTRHIP